MKARGILSSLGPFLIQMMSARRDNLDSDTARRAHNEASRRGGADAPTSAGVVIRKVKGAIKARPSQPAIVRLGPVVALLMMLRNRRPRRNRVLWHRLSLPPGCVLAVRYTSR